MSDDMSMFKKMKERITDEVNSATNKLQNMQIIDQIASSIAQQVNDNEPNQLLPQHRDSLLNFSNHLPVAGQYSLVDDSSISGLNEEEELNSETSPQHQLFDEHSIRRLGNTSLISFKNSNNSSSLNQKLATDSHQADLDNCETVINIDDISSDLEDLMDDSNECLKENDGSEVEIDLLSDKPTSSNTITIDRFFHCKKRYKDVVQAFRMSDRSWQNEKAKLESENLQLSNQIATLKTELDNSKQQHDSLLSVSTNLSDKDDKSNMGSPQPTTKSGQKLRDLEKLLAKCKDSLKVKNSKIQALRNSLSEVEKFKDSYQDLRRELSELREAHETWTVSIAENKRVMHQELENKNAKIELVQKETSDLKLRLNESHNKIKHLKSAIQDLESRLVSTSAAHQKERESLAKELTMVKNSAIRQIQKEHELNTERIKLDFEKSIEALKLEILNKDEQIINNSTQQRYLQDKIRSLNDELEETKETLREHAKVIDETKESHQKETEKLLAELSALKNKAEAAANLDNDNKQLSLEVESLKKRVSEMETVKSELEAELNKVKVSDESNGACKNCDELARRLKEEAEKFHQQMHEINTQLSILTTANEDQEKEIKSKETERNLLMSNNKALKSESDELLKKNESLKRVLTENEAEMQNQQVHLNQLTVIEHEMELLKEENASLVDNFDKLRGELSEKSAELDRAKQLADQSLAKVSKLESGLEIASKEAEDLRKETESIVCQNEKSDNQLRAQQEQLVLKILSIMKNLETPTSSPGSDKSYESMNQDSASQLGKKMTLPDSLNLLEGLSKLALDRSQSYSTTTQQLEAVLLDNTMMNEELKRLKSELNKFNRDKAEETKCSLEETEKLLSENQALIHDQQSYDEKISGLEEEIRTLTGKLEQIEGELKLQPTSGTTGGDHTYQIKALQRVLQQYQEENKRLKESHRILQEQLNKDPNTVDVPDSTEFEYLKNIVYQFMLGKEPLVLARVISAVFKFDRSQIDSICRKQEAVQAALKQSI